MPRVDSAPRLDPGTPVAVRARYSGSLTSPMTRAPRLLRGLGGGVHDGLNLGVGGEHGFGGAGLRLLGLAFRVHLAGLGEVDHAGVDAREFTGGVVELEDQAR
ncbi:hypothetical protein GCM10025876_29360 [Demequina litorisediminis]|uniref:Uncharacterized protein n=1 Tax=Demequina litorisediminis TaxID=1849022 RepID=A0ABQ6IFP9_9MICO|nr:hypothetical protein GCM10025876_29360 [Demequina litorisediminis]